MARGVTAALLVRLAVIGVSAGALMGCSDDGGQAAGAASAVPYKEIDPVGSAVRPERRYYVHNTNGNCVVYWIAPKARSIRRKVRCPREVLPSERLRLSGRVCFRESESVERRGPVRCPPSILRPERDDRADAGEYRLPAQKKP